MAAWIANLEELLTSELTGTLKEAASALEKALKTPEGRLALLASAHGVSRLIACLSNEDDDEEQRKGVVRCASRALAALSMDSAGRRGIIACCSDSLVRMSQLLRCNDLETAQCLSLIVGNLVLERSGRDLVLSCAPVVENLMGLVWSKDLKTLRYTTGPLLAPPIPSQYTCPCTFLLWFYVFFGVMYVAWSRLIRVRDAKCGECTCNKTQQSPRNVCMC